MSATSQALYMLVRPPSQDRIPAVVIPRREDEAAIAKVAAEERNEERRQVRLEADTVRPGKMML